MGCSITMRSAVIGYFPCGSMIDGIVTYKYIVLSIGKTWNVSYDVIPLSVDEMIRAVYLVFKTVRGLRILYYKNVYLVKIFLWIYEAFAFYIWTGYYSHQF